MRICELVKPTEMNITWIKQEFERRNVFIDNEFQRRYVWLKKHQVSLIETILMGYVIPEVYLWKVGVDPDTGEIKYSVVDGQQRIGAIVDFINGEYCLTKSCLSNPVASYAGKYFKDLSEEEKKHIWGYNLTFRIIPESVKKDFIVDVFLRLNSTDKSLNPQELRHAEYDGLFLKNAIDIADLDFWKKYDVFSANALRRMRDVEFVSSILIFFRKGIESEISQEAINGVYDLFNEEYDEADSDKKMITDILNCISDVVEEDNEKNLISYIKKNTHLYTLIVTCYKFIQKSSVLTKQQKKNLIDFYSKYENSSDTIALEYKKLFQEGTRSKQNRMRRVKILTDVIEGKIKIK